MLEPAIAPFMNDTHLLTIAVASVPTMLTELHRVEEVLDARLKHLEDR